MSEPELDELSLVSEPELDELSLMSELELDELILVVPESDLESLGTTVACSLAGHLTVVCAFL